MTSNQWDSRHSAAPAMRQRWSHLATAALATFLAILAVSRQVGTPATAAERTANGAIAFQNAAGPQMQIFTVAPDGTRLKNLSNNTANDYAPVWSPDGQHVAFTSDREPGIWIMDANGEHQRVVTVNRYSHVHPSWSPDGRFIAFESTQDRGDSEVYVMRADGADEVRLTNREGIDNQPEFSPDGKFIAFVSDRSGPRQIFLMTTSPDHTVTALAPTPFHQDDPHWSPDGTRLTFLSRPASDKQSGTMIVDREGGEIMSLAPSGIEAVWSPDGKKLAFTMSNVSGHRIWMMNPDGSDKHAITPDTPGIIPMVLSWRPSKLPSLELGTPAIGATSVTIDGNATPGDPYADVDSVVWDWGDGTLEQSGFPGTHVYARSGRFNVKVVVRQSDGLTAEASRTVDFVPLARKGVAPGVARDEPRVDVHPPIPTPTPITPVILPAPAQLSPADSTVFSHFPRTTTVRWTPVPGAQAYVVELDVGWSDGTWGSEKKDWPTMLRKVSGPEYVFEWLGAQPGRWRVWAIDATGQPGDKSPWWGFAYLQ